MFSEEDTAKWLAEDLLHLAWDRGSFSSASFLFLFFFGRGLVRKFSVYGSNPSLLVCKVFLTQSINKCQSVFYFFGINADLSVILGNSYCALEPILFPLPNSTSSQNLGNRCKMKRLPATVPIWTKRQELPSSPTPNVQCFGAFCGSPGLPAAHHGRRSGRSFLSLPHDDPSIMKERGQCLQDEYIAESALDICHAIPRFLR